MSDATMSSPEVERRQEIVREFQRRRTRELLAGVPFIAAFVVIYQLRANPEYEIGGLSGPPLLLAAIAVIAGVLLHHAVNWRCPACGRNFWRGINVPLCRHCGAVFVGPRKGGSVDPVGYSGQAERALQSDLGLYRARYARHTLRVLVLIGAGVLLIFLALSGAGRPEMKPAGVAFGGFLCLCGIVLMGFIVRAFTTGQRRYEARMRKMMKI